MLIDSAVITVRSGRGGDGSKSMRREKYIPKGGPDGGDGGKGGDVVFVADNQVATLIDFAGRHHWLAKPGQAGKGKGAYGKAANDLEVRVPVGTLVYDIGGKDGEARPVARDVSEEDEAAELEEAPQMTEEQALAALFEPFEPDQEDNILEASGGYGGTLLVDLAVQGQRFIVAHGGKGGRGNIKFATSTNQSPRSAEPGGPAEQRELRLELKLIADVGFVGLPNAGKSTLLSVVSAAKPKVANYPFTTLEPQLGLAELPGSSAGTRRMVMADLPGLIERASEGAGLGHRFLRHVERTRVLMHVLDAAPEGSTALESYRMVRGELEKYSPELAGKNEVIVLNKTDLLDQEAQEALRDELKGTPLEDAVWVSAASREGIRDLLERCWTVVQQAGDGESAASQDEVSGGWTV